MNKSEGRLIARALRVAMQFLGTNGVDVYDDHPHSKGENRRCEFLCHAVSYASGKDLITAEASIITRDYINTQLEGFGSLQCWMRANYPELINAIHDDAGVGCGHKMQTTRAAWIWSMICELEA